jgi:hypothetical protein
MDLHFSAFEVVTAFTVTLTGVASWLPFIPLAKHFLSARRAMIEDAGWQDEDLERRGLIE